MTELENTLIGSVTQGGILGLLLFYLVKNVTEEMKALRLEFSALNNNILRVLSNVKE